MTSRWLYITSVFWVNVLGTLLLLLLWNIIIINVRVTQIINSRHTKNHLICALLNGSQGSKFFHVTMGQIP